MAQAAIKKRSPEELQQFSGVLTHLDILVALPLIYRFIQQPNSVLVVIIVTQDVSNTQWVVLLDSVDVGSL